MLARGLLFSSLMYLCVHTGSLQQFKIRKHLENMRPCLADSPFSLCTRKSARTKGERVVHHSDLWQYRSFSALSSSMRVLFWFSKTATRFSRHLTYSFFFRRHSRAASLKGENIFEIYLVLMNLFGPKWGWQNI